MKCVQSSENGPGVAGKGSVELGQAVKDEKKEVWSGVAGDGQGRSQKDERRIAKGSEDASGRPPVSAVHPSADAQRPQLQPQGPLVCWERFLPVRSLKVLLVESDDSTRHVVSALLRNCSYEVTAVPNGMEAWKILEDLENQIDLVLTEVVMSGLSGIGLLSKIMTHKSCRNVPVIMMSSYDSMGIVLKCLSKGAADFLVKPIRKNELKNLWQHVWRRCHSSSGSGSESGIRNEKSTAVKSGQESDNDTGSNDEEDSRSFGLQARNGSDNGSGTQSSWTKRAAEVDSPQPPSLWDRIADPPDSTCAQVIYPRSEAFASSWVPVSSQKNKGDDNPHDNVPVEKDLEVEIAVNTDSQPIGASKKSLVANADKSQSSPLDMSLKNDNQNLDKKLEINKDKPKSERIREAVNLPGDVVNSDEHLTGAAGSEMPKILSEICKSKDEIMKDVRELPSLELSLKRFGDAAEASINVSEQNILRHSSLSAFTRYNTGSTANHGMTGNVGSCSPVENSSEAAKQPHSDSTPNQISNSSSNNNDMGSTTNRSTKPAVAIDKAPGKPILKCSHQTSAFQPTKNGPISEHQFMASGKASSAPVNVVVQENNMPQQVEIQHHHYHHHLVHCVQPPQKIAAAADLSCKSMHEKAPEVGSSNNKRVQTEATAVNCSLNGSACGSNHGSNMHNGSSNAAMNAEGFVMANDNGVAANDGTDYGSGSGSGSGSGVGVDHNRSAQREAALNKFRLKRKERCFEKKVRYQSRKKLAEQRPRVRGQFVRQVHENAGEDADS